MSSVPSPRVRKPKPRDRLNHLTMTISKPPTLAACARVRARRDLRGHRALAGVTDRTPKHLQAAFAPLRLGDDARPFADGLKAVAAQHRDVDQDVALRRCRAR